MVLCKDYLLRIDSDTIAGANTNSGIGTTGAMGAGTPVIFSILRPMLQTE